jgi:hypothetical protein
MQFPGVTAVVTKRQESDPHQFSAMLPHRLGVWRSQQAADCFSVARWIEALMEVASRTEYTHSSPSIERSGFVFDRPDGLLNVPHRGGPTGQVATPDPPVTGKFFSQVRTSDSI